MWPIDRLRRRLFGGPAMLAMAAPGSSSPGVRPTTVSELIVLAGADADRLGGALQRELRQRAERLDTPHRIERALSTFIAGRAGPGRPRVLRRPAGLTSPEAWEIHLDGVDPATVEAIREASRTGSFAR